MKENAAQLSITTIYGTADVKQQTKIYLQSAHPVFFFYSAEYY